MWYGFKILVSFLFSKFNFLVSSRYFPWCHLENLTCPFKHIPVSFLYLPRPRYLVVQSIHCMGLAIPSQGPFCCKWSQLQFLFSPIFGNTKPDCACSRCCSPTLEYWRGHGAEVVWLLGWQQHTLAWLPLCLESLPHWHWPMWGGEEGQEQGPFFFFFSSWKKSFVFFFPLFWLHIKVSSCLWLSVHSNFILCPSSLNLKTKPHHFRRHSSCVTEAIHAPSPWRLPVSQPTRLFAALMPHLFEEDTGICSFWEQIQLISFSLGVSFFSPSEVIHPPVCCNRFLHSGSWGVFPAAPSMLKEAVKASPLLAACSDLQEERAKLFFGML